jgi:hypothetical protein
VHSRAGPFAEWISPLVTRCSSLTVLDVWFILFRHALGGGSPNGHVSHQGAQVPGRISTRWCPFPLAPCLLAGLSDSSLHAFRSVPSVFFSMPSIPSKTRCSTRWRSPSPLVGNGPYPHTSCVPFCLVQQGRFERLVRLPFKEFLSVRRFHFQMSRLPFLSITYNFFIHLSER